MARKMRKFADGGNARYDRKVKDIESDYQKALKMGKEAGVAKAKYEQRMADAKDDLAKWTKADRTQTRAAEQAAERNLSEARRTKGESVRRSDAFGAKLAEKAPDLRGNTGNVEAVKTSSEPTTKPQSFAQAFRAARNELGAGKTFTWQGKSYSTNMAGEGASKPKAASTPAKREAPTAKSDGMDVMRRGTSAMAGALGRVNPVRGSMTSDGDSASKLAADIKRGSPFDKKTAPASSDPHADRVKAMIAAGKKPGASGYERSRAKFYEDNPDAMKKGGKVKKYAKGGKIDGCAVRGMTRAARKK